MKPGLRIWLLGALALLASCAPPDLPGRGGGVASVSQVSAPSPDTRHAMSYLVLTENGPADGQTRAFVATRDAGRVSVAFLVHGRGRYTLRASCDERARFRPRDPLATVPGWTTAGLVVRGSIAPGERARTLLDLEPGFNRCELTVQPGGRPAYRLELLNETRARPELEQLDTPPALCQPDAIGRTALERAFYGAGAGLALTCPQANGQTRVLADGSDAFNARVEALTGARLSQAQLAARDPGVSLDYSRAPRLELIYVNYLNLNADFAGYVMARMLAFHAARGTIVRILVSDIMLTGTDRALFEGLAAQYPTVQIQPYRFPGLAAQGLEEELSRFHRISHVKLFATIARDPRRSRALIGGRNIHEGYFFGAPGDLSAYPFLHQYDLSRTRLAGGFTAYDDLELEIAGAANVRDVVRHMSALWHRDFDTQAPLPQAESRAISSPAGSGVMRHFLSVPFADDTAQIDYFVALIDAAQHSIHIAMPYLNLPEPIAQAFERAHARGVQVDLVTTLTINEWSGAIITAFNRRFVERFAGWMAIRDYAPGSSMLHAKIIVIDEVLSIVASTNLNARSFYHDLENGLVILDRQVARDLAAVIARYERAGQVVAPEQEISGFLRWLMRLPMVRRGF